MAYQRSEVEKKYDRQMRLWGGHGQRNLGEGHVCCLGSGATATETLKNLVLPAVGHFTIIDDAKVTRADTGNNFFVTEADVGKNRAEAVAEWLVEMNPEVEIKAVVETPASQSLDIFEQFQLVIACGACVDEETALKIAAFCQEKNIPFLYNQAYGLIGRARVQLPEHYIIESHPSDDRTELYLSPDKISTIEGLEEWCMSFDLDAMSDEDLDHTPWPVIAVQKLKQWMDDHDGKKPKTWGKERRQFEATISDIARGDADFENLEQAVDNIAKLIKPRALDENTAAVYAESDNKNNDPFWVMTRACQKFFNEHGRYPVDASIPDMASDTAKYCELKKIYKTQADKDVEEVSTEVRKLYGPDEVHPDLIKRFCKNCRNLRVIRTRPLSQEYDASQFDGSFLGTVRTQRAIEITSPAPKPIQWYFALRAVEQFRSKNGAYPGVWGCSDEQLAKDRSEVLATMKDLFAAHNLEDEVEPSVATEITRYGGSEVHNTAAMMGGVGAQIALKLLLKQYVPVNHTYLFNGIFGEADTFAF